MNAKRLGKLLAQVFLCAGALWLQACSNALPVTPLQPLKSSLATDVVWKSKVGSSDNAVLAPVLYKDVLYLATEKGELMALDPATGSESWHVKTKEPFSAGIGVGQDLLFLGNKNGELLAYDLKGGLVWRSQQSSELTAPPEAAEGTVVTRTADGHIVGLNVTDGKRRWQVLRPQPALVLRGVSGITISRGGVLVGLPGGKLLALNLAQGTVVWEATISVPKGATELERVNDVLGAPIVGFQDVCTASYQGKTTCLEVSRGQTIWSKDEAAIGPIFADGNKLFVTDDKGDVVALNRLSGTTAWRNDSLEGRYLSPPVVTADYVVVGDAEGIVHFLSRGDGVESGRVSTDGTAITQPPLVIGDNLVLVRNRAGKVFAVAPR
ncbi:MAG: outer membrane protein assembly factor BamB [Betaproteobacteria bacterium]|nr:outer membrane protein assembly factor BamB [Betaproteobacteria bacterium]